MAFLVIYSTSNSPKEINGKVMDKGTNNITSGAMVVVNKSDTTYTDEKGYFVIKNIDTLKTINISSNGVKANELGLVKFTDVKEIKK